MEITKDADEVRVIMSNLKDWISDILEGREWKIDTDEQAMFVHHFLLMGPIIESGNWNGYIESIRKGKPWDCEIVWKKK